MNLFATATTTAARLLPPNVQDAVLGDLEESNASQLKTFVSVCDVLARRELEPWRSWQPWAAAAAALPAGFLLLTVSFCLAMDSRPLLHGNLATGGWPLLSEALLLLAWAWTTGFAISTLARRTAWASAAICAMPCLSCVAHFREPSLSRFSVLLFLTPAVAGAIAGRRLKRLRFTPAILLASFATGLMFAWIGMCPWFWFLLVPAWFLVATAHEPGASQDSGRLPATRRHIAINLLLVLVASLTAHAAAPTSSQVVAREIDSKSFTASKIKTDPVRRLAVYLPPGYDASQQRYPVVYFFPSPFDATFRDIFDKQDAQAVLDRAIHQGAIHGFILVAVDMTTPVGSSWYVNSTATGNWEDFVIRELVPYIDASFRTLASRDSRGISGYFMGGYGALRLAMEHPDIFGSVYALHPVGTGSGVKILAGLPNWDLMQNAKSLDDVKKDGYSTIFTSIFEAHVPNPDNPPLYIDFPARRVNGQLVIDTKIMDRLRNNFFIESLIGQYADNLKSLRGFKFDWSRTDSNFDHVYSNQALTHKLNEYGIPHEAEEYNAPPTGDPNWGSEGRITTDVLPFFQQHLVFQ